MNDNIYILFESKWKAKAKATHLFMAIARVEWVSYEIEPKLMAPKDEKFTTYHHDQLL